MHRKLSLQIALAAIGLLFLAMAWPMILFVRQEPALSMMMSVYATLGVFLLLAVPNPGAHRSLIAFTAWSSLAHAVLMGIQVERGMVAHGEFVGVVVLAVIGAVLLVLRPPVAAPHPAPIH